MVSLLMEWIATKKPFPPRTRKDIARGTTLFRSIGLRDFFAMVVAGMADTDPHWCGNGHTVEIGAPRSDHPLWWSSGRIGSRHSGYVRHVRDRERLSASDLSSLAGNAHTLPDSRLYWIVV